MQCSAFFGLRQPKRRTRRRNRRLSRARSFARLLQYTRRHGRAAGRGDHPVGAELYRPDVARGADEDRAQRRGLVVLQAAAASGNRPSVSHGRSPGALGTCTWQTANSWTKRPTTRGCCALHGADGQPGKVEVVAGGLHIANGVAIRDGFVYLTDSATGKTDDGAVASAVYRFRLGRARRADQGGRRRSPSGRDPQDRLQGHPRRRRRDRFR